MPTAMRTSSMGRTHGPRLLCRFSSFEHPKSFVKEAIQSHPLNHALQVLLPEDDSTPSPERANAAEWLDVEQSTYYRVTANLGLVAEDLVCSSLVGQRDLVLQAIAASGSAALTPDGVLHLAFGAETYRYLGIAASKSSFHGEEACSTCVGGGEARAERPGCCRRHPLGLTSPTSLAIWAAQTTSTLLAST